MYFELEGTGSVSFCVQTTSQQAAGACDTASGSPTSGPGCPTGTSGLTLSYAASGPSQCFNVQTTTNGIRLINNQQGWILSDLISTTAVTTFYVTIEALSGASTAVGVAERADGSGCSTSNYPTSSWVGYAGSTCKGDFLTFYTAKPSGATTAITSLMTVGHTYKFIVFPNAGPSNSRCAEITITGTPYHPFFSSY